MRQNPQSIANSVIMPFRGAALYSATMNSDQTHRLQVSPWGDVAFGYGLDDDTYIVFSKTLTFGNLTPKIQVWIICRASLKSA